MLYNEVNAEKSFLTLINAAVSHELRNPLNSLTAQITAMTEMFEEFSEIITNITDIIVKTNLERIYNSMFNFGKKMTSSTKFIDFFVHDILDYTILNKDEKSFTKNI